MLRRCSPYRYIRGYDLSRVVYYDTVIVVICRLDILYSVVVVDDANTPEYLERQPRSVYTLVQCAVERLLYEIYSLVHTTEEKSVTAWT